MKINNYINYENLYNTNYQLVLPLETNFMIPENDSVRLLNKVLEGLDYSELLRTYSTYGRKSAISPVTLFKVLAYANMECIYSSRDIEKACRRDVNFMWLLQGQKVPDHSTIARFRRNRLSRCIENLFFQIINLLFDMQELKFKNIFIDGTKIEANANKYSYVWLKTTKQLLDKLLDKIDTTLKDFNEKFKTSFKNNQIYEILDFLAAQKNILHIDFVSGKGKRKTSIQRYTELFNEFAERLNKYNKALELFNGRNSYSKTDIDATFMHMKEDHMRNSQLKPAYNVQFGVEGEYIVGVYVSSDRTDYATLIPLLDKIENNLSHRYKSVTADAGYESEENYIKLEQRKIKSFIKPSTYDTVKKRSFKSLIGRHENMIYDKSDDLYICHNNKKLHKVGTKTRKSKSGYTITLTIYRCDDCCDCQYKSKCTKSKGNKQIEISKVLILKRNESLKNVTSPRGIIYRINRSIQSEGTFGIMKQDKKFSRFSLRGKANVTTEILLKAISLNIEKLHNKIQKKCTRKLFHFPQRK